ncbi:MAG: class II glutamine amidotransferase [Solirubrobacterales bacterium]|nr:class II glutamine amidotransferase [Solirubrobacterales bacterium]
MCRLFGMSGGPRRVAATFWLVQAPDSLAQQSHREPDGTGLGTFDERGRPEVAKQPLAAYEDRQFALEAKEVRSHTFVAHIRYASTGAVSPKNTHPFEQAGRLFAHNGVIGDLPALERELGDAISMVQGDTDSERFFALITRSIERTDGISSGIEQAAGWVAAHLPVFALNFVLIAPRELWAFRYPDTHGLYVLERAAGGPSGSSHLEHASPWRTVRVRSAELARAPAVVVASERMDEDPAWRELQSGELLHVDPELRVTVTRLLERPPTHQLTLADLDPKAAASQAAQKRA